jgi:hypothetical protein
MARFQSGPWSVRSSASTTASRTVAERRALPGFVGSRQIAAVTPCSAAESDRVASSGVMRSRSAPSAARRSKPSRRRPRLSRAAAEGRPPPVGNMSWYSTGLARANATCASHPRRRSTDVVAAGELKTVGDAAGSASARVDGGGDADELDARPAQEHSQGARVIGVAAEVGVEMDPHHTSMPQAWEPEPSSMPRSSQRFLRLSSFTRPSPTRQAARCRGPGAAPRRPGGVRRYIPRVRTGPRSVHHLRRPWRRDHRPLRPQRPRPDRGLRLQRCRRHSIRSPSSRAESTQVKSPVSPVHHTTLPMSSARRCNSCGGSSSTGLLGCRRRVATPTLGALVSSVTSRHLVRAWNGSSRLDPGAGSAVELRQPPPEQAPLGVVVDQCQGSAVGLAGLPGASQAPQQLAARGVQVVVVP